MKETADEFHCTGFTITDKGAVILSGTVKDVNGSMNYNCPQRSISADHATAIYDYTDDLRDKIRAAQNECALYISGKVHPDSVAIPDAQGDLFEVNETPVNGIKGVGGKSDTDLNTYQDVDVTNRIADVNETQKQNEARESRKKGGKQTPENPSGK